MNEENGASPSGSQPVNDESRLNIAMMPLADRLNLWAEYSGLLQVDPEKFNPQIMGALRWLANITKGIIKEVDPESEYIRLLKMPKPKHPDYSSDDDCSSLSSDSDEVNAGMTYGYDIEFTGKNILAIARLSINLFRVAFSQGIEKRWSKLSEVEKRFIECAIVVIFSGDVDSKLDNKFKLAYGATLSEIVAYLKQNFKLFSGGEDLILYVFGLGGGDSDEEEIDSDFDSDSDDPRSQPLSAIASSCTTEAPLFFKALFVGANSNLDKFNEYCTTLHQQSEVRLHTALANVYEQLLNEELVTCNQEYGLTYEEVYDFQTARGLIKPTLSLSVCKL